MNYLLSFVFDSCDNLDTTGVSSRTGVISAIYKKSDKRRHCKPKTHFTFKFRLQNLHFSSQKSNAKTLDIIVGENQLERTILHALFRISVCNELSSILSKHLAVISLDFLMAFDRVDWDFIFSAICKFGYRNKFISTIQVAYTNIHPKFRINGLLSFLPLSNDFVRVVNFYCCYAFLRLTYLQFSLMPIPGLKVYK